ncbi:hypothetical protein L1987_42579 [Smallanthus sonchifolius]|uniref:Uncharacterized protein n=1 Tax=Smallanthus sonchifolius TaxID=185202 RepID=A0ACB9GJ62_9ASTR|nr:hypothetical protein L1987_42579 [Smallanthus sonchifolius]
MLCIAVIHKFLVGNGAGIFGVNCKGYFVCVALWIGPVGTSEEIEGCHHVDLNQGSNVEIILHSQVETKARLAQLVERKALNLVVVNSSPTVGDLFFWLSGVVWSLMDAINKAMEEPTIVGQAAKTLASRSRLYNQ